MQSEPATVDATTPEELTVSIQAAVLDDLMGLLALLSQDPLRMSPAKQASYSSAANRKLLAIAKEQAREMVAAWYQRDTQS